MFCTSHIHPFAPQPQPQGLCIRSLWSGCSRAKELHCKGSPAPSLPSLVLSCSHSVEGILGHLMSVNNLTTVSTTSKMKKTKQSFNSCMNLCMAWATSYMYVLEYVLVSTRMYNTSRQGHSHHLSLSLWGSDSISCSKIPPHSLSLHLRCNKDHCPNQRGGLGEEGH